MRAANDDQASESFDLDRYLLRIGYAGPRVPSLATLAAVAALHPTVIPFENLDPLVGRPVRLDLASLQAKMVAARRGGYCFEQNTLLAAALDALGFAVVRLAGRVRWMAPPERPDSGRTHMLLAVTVDGQPYIVDAGFGAHLFAGPIALTPDVEQRVPPATFRVTGGAEAYTLQSLLPKGWQDVYRFNLEPQLPADYEMANWFALTNPASRFGTTLLAERLTPDCRFTLSNTRLTHRYADGRTHEETLPDAAALGEALATAFHIDPPAPAADIWSRIPK